MPTAIQEIMEVFKQLTPENQANLLAMTQVALVAESSVKKTLAAPAADSGVPASTASSS